ncbi:ribonuclease H-like domain-containing protein [Tanacetum coccineum]
MALSRPPELGFSDFPAMLFEPVSITAKSTRLFSSFTRGQTRLTYYCMWMISFLQLLLVCSCNTKYATEILERAQMLNCNPCKTPDDTEKKLGPEGSPITDPTLYRSLAGALQYLTFTRPDLSYAVQQLCCPATRQSTSGYCNFLSDNLLTWSSKLQDMLSRSSVEAEYHGVANDQVCETKDSLQVEVQNVRAHSIGVNTIVSSSFSVAEDIKIDASDAQVEDTKVKLMRVKLVRLWIRFVKLKIGYKLKFKMCLHMSEVGEVVVSEPQVDEVDVDDA